MTLIVASGGSGIALAAFAEAAPQPQLWIAHDLEPGNGADALRNQPWTALIALSERIAHPDPRAALAISALDGFGTPPERTVTAQDHTEQSRRLSAAVANGRFDYASIVVATMSGLYDDACSRMLVSSPGTDRSLDAARQIASSAVSHFAWNLGRAGMPVVLLSWLAERTLKGKVVGETPHLPRRLLAMADAIIDVAGHNESVVRECRSTTDASPSSTDHRTAWDACLNGKDRA